MKHEILDSNYLDLIKNIRIYFSEAKNSIWDKRNKIKIIKYLEKDIAVKSFGIPHMINKLAYTFFRDSKAKRSYQNSLRILEFVPKPIAYVEFKKFGLFYDSYFLCEQYDHDFTIREPLTQKSFENKTEIFKLFAEFTYALHKKGVEHLDYSPGNILIKKISSSKYEFKIVDVNRMRFKIFAKGEQLENFSKLWADDDDLALIAKHYAELIGVDKEEAIAIAIKASHRHKDKKNFKKKLLKYTKKNINIRKNLKENKALLKQISIAMIAKNAEEMISESLSALRDFEEVILYLNNSTDKTKDIAKKFSNVKIIEGDFIGFGDTKNKAASYASNDWILSLDSDEVLNEKLISEILKQDFSDKRNLFVIKRDNYFLGKKTVSKDYIVRIYNRQHTGLNANLVHEKVDVQQDSRLIRLRQSFKHHNITDINQTLSKMMQYTDLGAKGHKTCYFIIVLVRALFVFFKTYFFRMYFINGWRGFVIAITYANRRFYKYLKQYISCKNIK